VITRASVSVVPELAEYDPSRLEQFAVESAALTEALGGYAVAIEHVGSTAVPGLAGKPTIDIAAGVTTLDLDADVWEAVIRRGYTAAEPRRPDEKLFRRGRDVPWQVIVHVVAWGGPAWRDYLVFRNALRLDPELAGNYERLKRRLLLGKQDWYRGVDKEHFIESVLEAAPAQLYVLSGSAQETERVAARLAKRLAPGDVVYVCGELGAGKTTFVRGAVHALGVTGPVTRPTYTIGNRYDGVSHLDLYRFDELTDADWGALEPYFADAIVFVEWPERAGGRLPAPRVTVLLGHVDDERRSIELSSADPDLLAGLL